MQVFECEDKNSQRIGKIGTRWLWQPWPRTKKKKKDLSAPSWQRGYSMSGLPGQAADLCRVFHKYIVVKKLDSIVLGAVVVGSGIQVGRATCPSSLNSPSMHHRWPQPVTAIFAHQLGGSSISSIVTISLYSFRVYWFRSWHYLWDHIKSCILTFSKVTHYHRVWVFRRPFITRFSSVRPICNISSASLLFFPHFFASRWGSLSLVPSFITEASV